MKLKAIWDKVTLSIEIISVLFVSAVGGVNVYKMATDSFRFSTFGTILAFLMFIALMVFIEFMVRLFMFMWDSMR